MKPPTILVADDETHVVNVLAIKLREAGYDVVIALDGEEALALAQSEHPALVITDFQMPYMTGLELGAALAADPATAAIPVVILTARGHAFDHDDLTGANIREVISKPFSPRAVLRHVEALLGGGPRGSEETAA